MEQPKDYLEEYHERYINSYTKQDLSDARIEGILIGALIAVIGIGLFYFFA